MSDAEKRIDEIEAAEKAERLVLDRMRRKAVRDAAVLMSGNFDSVLILATVECDSFYGTAGNDYANVAVAQEFVMKAQDWLARGEEDDGDEDDGA